MSDELENRKRKSRKDSRKEKTKTGAEKRITTKKATKKTATQDKQNPMLQRGEERFEEARSGKRNGSLNTQSTNLV